MELFRYFLIYALYNSTLQACTYAFNMHIEYNLNMMFKSFGTDV